MNKRITLINQVTGPMFVDMANEFLKKYDEVVLITGSVETTYSKLDERIKLIFRIKYQRKNPIMRILTWLIFFTQSIFYLIFNKNHGKLFLATNPPILPFLISFFSKKTISNSTILIYDIYPDTLSNFGYLNEKSLLFRIWNYLNNRSYDLASEIITISDSMKENLEKKVKSKEIKVVYPWTDTSFIKPICKNENWFLAQNKLIDKRVVLYSGNMGITHDLITVLKVAKEITSILPQYHFLFIGDGPQKKN